MKNLVIAFTLLLSTAAMACPGGNIMTFQFAGQDAFELNMQDGKMTPAKDNSNGDIALLSLKVNGSETCREEVHGRSKCSDLILYWTIMGTGSKSLEKSLFGQRMKLEVTMTDGRSEKSITSKQFPFQARGMAVAAQL